MPGPVALPALTSDSRRILRHQGTAPEACSMLSSIADPKRSMEACLTTCSSDSTPDNSHLWSLWKAIAEEATASASLVSAKLPQREDRRWFTSFHAQSQWLLKRNDFVRRSAYLLRWLESCASATGTGQLRIFATLRAGDHTDAIRIATDSDPVLAGLLSAITPLGCTESWHSAAMVPLFGEFKSTVCDSNRRPDNAHRLQLMQNLQRLLSSWDQGFARVVVAHIIGDEETLLSAFSQQPSRLDTLWVKLRCAMVKAFAYTAVRLGADEASAEYTRQLEHDLGIADTTDWEAAINAKLGKIVSDTTTGSNDLVMNSIALMFELRNSVSTEVQTTPTGTAVQLCAQKMHRLGLRNYNVAPPIISASLLHFAQALADEASWPDERSRTVVQLACAFADRNEIVAHLVKTAASCASHADFDIPVFSDEVRQLHGPEVADAVVWGVADQQRGAVAGAWLRWIRSPTLFDKVSTRFSQLMRDTWRDAQQSTAPIASAAASWLALEEHSACAAPPALQTWMSVAAADDAIKAHALCVASANRDGRRRLVALRATGDQRLKWAAVVSHARASIQLGSSGADTDYLSTLVASAVGASCLQISSSEIDSARSAFQDAVELVAEHSRASSPKQYCAADLLRQVRSARAALGQRIHDQRLCDAGEAHPQ